MYILSSHHTFLIISKVLSKFFEIIISLQYLMIIHITVVQDLLLMGKLKQNRLITTLTVLNVLLNPLSFFTIFQFFL